MSALPTMLQSSTSVSDHAEHDHREPEHGEHQRGADAHRRQAALGAAGRFAHHRAHTEHHQHADQRHDDEQRVDDDVAELGGVVVAGHRFLGPLGRGDRLLGHAGQQAEGDEGEAGERDATHR